MRGASTWDAVGTRVGSPPHRSWWPALGLMAGVVLIWLAAVLFALRAAALPPGAAGTLFVVFPPGTPSAQAFASIVEAGGRPLRPAFGAWAWIAHADESGFVGRLEAEGALAAFPNAPLGAVLAGCLGIAVEPSEDQVLRQP